VKITEKVSHDPANGRHGHTDSLSELTNQYLLQ